MTGGAADAYVLGVIIAGAAAVGAVRANTGAVGTIACTSAAGAIVTGAFHAWREYRAAKIPWLLSIACVRIACGSDNNAAGAPTGAAVGPVRAINGAVGAIARAAGAISGATGAIARRQARAAGAIARAAGTIARATGATAGAVGGIKSVVAAAGAVAGADAIAGAVVDGHEASDDDGSAGSSSRFSWTSFKVSYMVGRRIQQEARRPGSCAADHTGASAPTLVACRGGRVDSEGPGLPRPRPVDSEFARPRARADQASRGVAGSWSFSCLAK